MSMDKAVHDTRESPAVEVDNLAKRYASVQAVDELSFTVNYGEIFGLLGPNGAGKTTTIRMILDIIKPTAGRISVLGGPMREETKAHIGYLPEERGLYDDMTLLDTLLFLGQLKGLSRQTAQERAERYLRQVELWDERERQIKALSRGMRQKAQFVAAILHEPELVIVDEPFSGLDPINTRIIKNLIYAMRERGAAIVMSTHQMHQVEEMCQRILLMDRGRRVLYGTLDEIRQRFTDHAIEVEVKGELESVSGVARLNQRNGSYRLLLEENVQPETVLQQLMGQPEITVERFARVRLGLDEIFVRTVGREIEEGDLGSPEEHAR